MWILQSGLICPAGESLREISMIENIASESRCQPEQQELAIFTLLVKPTPDRLPAFEVPEGQRAATQEIEIELMEIAPGPAR